MATIKKFHAQLYRESINGKHLLYKTDNLNQTPQYFVPDNRKMYFARVNAQ